MLCWWRFLCIFHETSNLFLARTGLTWRQSYCSHVGKPIDLCKNIRSWKIRLLLSYNQNIRIPAPTTAKLKYVLTYFRLLYICIMRKLCFSNKTMSKSKTFRNAPTHISSKRYFLSLVYEMQCHDWNECLRKALRRLKLQMKSRIEMLQFCWVRSCGLCITTRKGHQPRFILKHLIFPLVHVVCAVPCAKCSCVDEV